MKKLLFIISFSLVSIVAISQQVEVLTVATLIPNKVSIPSNLSELLQEYHVNCIQPTADFITEKYDSLQNAIQSDSNLGQNLKAHYKNQIESSVNLNSTKNYSLTKAGSIQNFLSYKEANILARFFDTKADGTIESLQKIADSLSVRYVVNFPLIEYQEADGLIAINSRTQLYDNKYRTIVIDEVSEYPNSLGGSTKQTCTYGDTEIVLVHSDSWIFRKVLFAIKNDETEKIMREEIERSQRDSINTLNFETIKQILIDNSVSTSGLIDANLSREDTKFMAFYANRETGRKGKCIVRYSLLSGIRNGQNWLIEEIDNKEVKEACDKSPTSSDVFKNLDSEKLDNFISNY
ncbi:MAG: hypothetical protein AB8B73_01590 [Ekhidna sp.]